MSSRTARLPRPVDTRSPEAHLAACEAVGAALRAILPPWPPAQVPEPTTPCECCGKATFARHGNHHCSSACAQMLAAYEENAGRDLAAARVEAGLAETIPAPECPECAEEKAGEFCSGKCERAAEKTEQEREQARLYPTHAAYRNGVPQ